MEDIKFEKIPNGIYDKVKNNREEFVEKFIDELEELFPDTVKDGKVDFEALLERFGEYQDNDERYELTWVGKNKARQESFEDLVGKTLKYIEEDSKNPDTTENLYIEGDNLEVLKLLRNSYYGKIKMIYIDPPYNTGNDFVYKDDFTLSKEDYDDLKGDLDDYGRRLVKNSSDSGRYHSDWLNMIYPRLQVAKDLLTDDGAIFISIDDHEVHNLRKICDEVFGEENFVAEFLWEKKKKPSFLHKNVGKLFEYILCYNKNLTKSKEFSIETTTKGKKYPLNNAGNSKQKLVFKSGSVEFNLKDQIILPQDMSGGNIYTKLLNEVEIVNGKNKNDMILDGEWRYSQETLDEIIENNEQITISKIPFRPNHIKKGGEIKKMKNVFSRDHYNSKTNEDATEELYNLFESEIFNNPKPVDLLVNLIKSITYDSKNAIVLDFFSGSSTTAHAVMDLNAQDGGNRKYIMVQIEEDLERKVQNTTGKSKKIIENSIKFLDKENKPCFITEIGKERIRRAGEKIREDNKDKEGIEDLDTGFKVFRVEDTNFRRIREVENQDLESKYKSLSKKDREDFNSHFTDLDVVYELMLRRQDIELTEEIRQLEDIGDRTYIVGDTMLVCLEEDISEEMVEKIGDIDTDLSWIVLRDSAFDDKCDLKINTAKKLRSIIKSSRRKNQKIYWI